MEDIINFYKIIDTVPVSIYWKNKAGTYLGCNKYMLEMAGLNQLSDIIGKKDSELPWKKIAPTLSGIDNHVIKTGTPIEAEEKPLLANKQEKIFLTTKTPLTDNAGKIIGVIGISIDITKEKEAQEALKQANYARLEFISTASHEVINPASCVVTLAERLKENFASLKKILPKRKTHNKQTNKTNSISRLLAETLDNCQDIQSAAERTMIAIRNLAALHHMQLSGVTAYPMLFTIQLLVDVAINRSTYPNTQNICIKKSIDPAVPRDFLIDVENVMQAIGIVIGNAFRFSHPGGEIHLTVKKTLENKKPCLVISVQDFGVGMHQAQIKDLSTTSLRSKKESLYSKPSVQLSRVKMYLEASKGRLEIESVLNQGTEVKLIVPYKLPLQKNKVSEEIMDPVLYKNKRKKQRAIPTPPAATCSVLLVEDDPITRKLTSQKLVDLGYKIDVAKDGGEAIQMAMAHDYTVILLDITLPDINGLEVMRQIRASKGEDAVFIALSSHASEEKEEYFMRQGVTTLLAKPVTSKQLKSVIDAALEINAQLAAGYD